MGYPKYSEDLTERSMECWERMVDRRRERQAQQRADAVNRAADLNLHMLSSGSGCPPIHRSPTASGQHGHVRLCRDCGAVFWISANDMAHCEKTGQTPPTHCGTCRQKRRAKQNRRSERRRAASAGILQGPETRQR